jgi:hypothetical protein
LAGTIRLYSKNAIPQLIRMAFHMGNSGNFKLPYQAKVINTLEAKSKRMVFIKERSFEFEVEGKK